MKLISRFIFWLFGWKIEGAYPADLKKSVMVAAQHTSNWDFLFTRAAFFIMGIPVRYTVKKELMFFPLGLILRGLGAIAIDRNPNPEKPKRSMVEAMQALFDERERLVVLVTPEGTRSKVDNWKTGFYHVAVGAKVPIVLGYLDYSRKVAGIGPVIQPTGNLETQLKEIQDFYKTVVPKHPEKRL